MKTRVKEERGDDLRPEYTDLSELLKGVLQGKYAERCEKGTNTVLLAPDVAQALPSADAVNEALRLVIQLRTIPVAAKARGATKAHRGGRRSG